MIRILLTIMAAAVILPIVYFKFNDTPVVKRMLVAGTILAAAFIAVFLQFLNAAFYVPLLSIVAISMIGAIVYAKLDEREKVERRRIAEERKQKQQITVPVQKTVVEEIALSSEPESPLSIQQETTSKPFAMQTIGVGGEER